MFIIGIFIILAGIFFSAVFISNQLPDLAIFFNLPVIFTFAWVSVAVTLATGNIKTYIMAVNALISKKYHISAADKEKAISYLKLMSKTVIYTAIIITVMSAALFLTQVSDLTTLGPNLVNILTSIFYAALVNIIFTFPGIHILESRYNQEEKRVISEKQVIDKLLELCYKQNITPEEIIEANEIGFKK